VQFKEELAQLSSEIERLKAIEKAMRASPGQRISLADPRFTFDNCTWARLSTSSATTCRSLWTRAII